MSKRRVWRRDPACEGERQTSNLETCERENLTKPCDEGKMRRWWRRWPGVTIFHHEPHARALVVRYRCPGPGCLGQAGAPAGGGPGCGSVSLHCSVDHCGSSRRGELLQRLRPTRLSPPRRPPPLTPASARARPSRASHQQPHKLVILRVPAAPPWSYPLRCLHSLRWRATQSSSCARRTDNAAVRPPASAASAHTRLAAVRLRAAAALYW